MGNILTKRQTNSKPSAREQIEDIRRQAMDLRHQVEQFSGAATDKEYIYLDEMLTTFMLKLDVVDTEGKQDVRQARKAVLQEIQVCASLLESKVGS